MWLISSTKRCKDKFTYKFDRSTDQESTAHSWVLYLRDKSTEQRDFMVYTFSTCKHFHMTWLDFLLSHRRSSTEMLFLAQHLSLIFLQIHRNPAEGLMIISHDSKIVPKWTHITSYYIYLIEIFYSWPVQCGKFYGYSPDIGVSCCVSHSVWIQ